MCKHGSSELSRGWILSTNWVRMQAFHIGDYNLPPFQNHGPQIGSAQEHCDDETGLCILKRILNNTSANEGILDDSMLPVLRQPFREDPH